VIASAVGFTGDHLNPHLIGKLHQEPIKCVEKCQDTWTINDFTCAWCFRTMLAEYERGVTRFYTRVYGNPDVSFTIHPDFHPRSCYRSMLQSERVPFVPLNKA
jgi:hypothetical protein